MLENSRLYDSDGCSCTFEQQFEWGTSSVPRSGHNESGFLRQSLEQILKTGLKRVWAEPSGFGQSPIRCAGTSTKATLGSGQI